MSTILTVTTSLALADSGNTTCPTWFSYNHATNQCECVGIEGMIRCSQERNVAMVANGVCVTSSREGLYLAGECPLRNRKNNTDRMWSELPRYSEDLNTIMCGPYNREGLLCGQCIDGYGLPVYSSDLECVNCSVFSQKLSIPLYLLIQFVPVTLFFLCIIIFRLKITSGPLLGYFLFCQLYYEETTGINRHVFDYIQTSSLKPLKVLFFISQTFTELWNLLFFKSLVPPFCISQHLSSIQLQILTLVPATYAILFFITMCLLVKLHGRNYRVARFLEKPFVFIGHKLKMGTISSDSIVRAFATCILLSTTTTAYNLLALTDTTAVYNMDGEITESVYNIDPEVLYFSEIALPLMAVTIPCLFLVLVPALLLIIYPTRIYRRLSRCISARKQLAITAFAEALHGCFKDGLNGTTDYRALAGLIILILPLFATLNTSPKHVVAGYSCLCFSGFVLLFLSFIISCVKPCKSRVANFSLGYHSMMAGVIKFGLHLWIKDLSTDTKALELTLIIIPLISHILVTIWMGYCVSQYIRMHYGLNISLHPVRVMWSDCVRFVKLHVQGERCYNQALLESARM